MATPNTISIDKLARLIPGAGRRLPKTVSTGASSLGGQSVIAICRHGLGHGMPAWLRDAGMILYDAFYRWCRDATAETHDWLTNKVGGAR